MLTGRQIRERRALLGLTRSQLVYEVKTVTFLTIMRAEEFDGEPPMTTDKAAAIERAFDHLGVEFASGAPRLRNDGL